jgi:PAS domain S-box-containing protein
VGWIGFLWYRKCQTPQVQPHPTHPKTNKIALQQYERMISAVTDGLSLVDRNYVYQFVNSVYLQYNNKQYDEIVGHSVGELLGQIVFETLVKPKLDQCLAGQTIQYEAWFDYPTLGRQFVRVTYSPYHEIDGTITGVLVSIHNLTKLKQAEETLQRYQHIVSNMSDGIALVDRNYIYQVVNPTYLTWYQKNDDEIIGHSISDLSSQEVFENTIKPRLDQCLAGQILQYQDWFIDPDQDNQFIDVTYAPYYNADQEILGVVMSLRNLTELKRAEETLVQREEQLIAAQQIAHVGSWQLNLTTQQRDWSDETFHMFGRDPGLGEPMPEEFLQMVHPDDRPQFQTQLERAIAHRELLKVEYRVIRPDGSVRHLETRAEPITNSDGQVVKLVGAVLDITEKKHAEAQLKASLREKEVLLQEVHHRVKNNLQIVDSLLYMQARRAKDPQAIAALQDSQSRIASIALVHKKLYGSDNFANINFAQYIQDLTAYLFESYDTQSRGVTLITHLDKISLNIKTAIPCGLVINELISNALKYAFPAGRQGKIQIDFYQSEDQMLTLIVRDDGVGLPASFDLQPPQSLGMMLVQELVEQINGTLTLSKQQGTEFIIKFPQENQCL